MCSRRVIVVIEILRDWQQRAPLVWRQVLPALVPTVRTWTLSFLYPRMNYQQHLTSYTYGLLFVVACELSARPLLLG